MKPEELRIGNLVLLPNGNMHVVERTDFEYKRGLANIEDFQDVPLTEQLLIDFGFERGVDFWHKDGITLDIRTVPMLWFELRLPRYLDVGPPIVVRSANRLQNLYQAYTEKELPIP